MNRKPKIKFKYQFEISHITIIFIVVIISQIILAYVQKSSLNDFLTETQTWYRKYSADRLAIITATSMELLFENLYAGKISEYEDRNIDLIL